MFHLIVVECATVCIRCQLAAKVNGNL